MKYLALKRKKAASRWPTLHASLHSERTHNLSCPREIFPVTASKKLTIFEAESKYYELRQADTIQTIQAYILLLLKVII
jgi:hypothetical protein